MYKCICKYMYMYFKCRNRTKEYLENPCFSGTKIKVCLVNLVRILPDSIDSQPRMVDN